MNTMSGTTQAEIVYEKRVIQNIPCVISYKNDNIVKPLMILCHGFRGNKEFFPEEVRQLTQRGYLVIVPDNRLHGDRKGPKFQDIAFINGKLDTHQVRKAIKETADDIVLLIDHLIEKEQVDSNRIGIAGVSMGGCITYRVLVIDSRIKTAIPIIGTPHWEDTPITADVLETKEIREKLKEFGEKYNPANYPDRFFPRPLLIQITENDVHVNTEKIKNFYHQLTPYYTSAPEKLKLTIHPNLAHDYTKEMWEQALSWIQKYL